MKKISYFITFCFLLSAFSLNAQTQFEDSSFEIWKDKTGMNGPYKEYETEYFYTLNSLFALENSQGTDKILTAFREGNAQHQNWCIRLTSGKVPAGEDVFLPGMVGTITQDFVNEFLNNEGKVTITRDWYGWETPHALEGWYKYTPMYGDSAVIDIGFYDRNGEELIEVFVSEMKIKETVANWTKFTIVIPEQYRNRMFNDIRVLFVASAGINFEELQKCKGQLGSTLWIDNISLNYNYTGIKQNLLSTLKVKTFPNPAAEVLNLELNEHFTGKVMVYNSLGGLIMEENINGTLTQLNTAALASGNYLYRVMESNTIFAQGKFVVAR
jgi:hypothetical protein